MPHKIVLTGAPGTGKTTILNLLKAQKYSCFDEISRKIIQQAQLKGSLNIFESQPILFSEQLLVQRQIQFEQAEKQTVSHCFLDRGLPDIIAYLAYANQIYDFNTFKSVDDYVYDLVFIFPPWKAIYTKDAQRLETFAEAQKIHQYIVNAYKKKHSLIIEVPFDTIENRLSYIKTQIDKLWQKL